MSVDVTPGSVVRVKLTKPPTREAAAKTLSRLFAKDQCNRKARRERKQLLKSAATRTRRGGRIWMVRSKAPRLFQPTEGDACTLLATCDVLRDLRSVERFVEIIPAT